MIRFLSMSVSAWRPFTLLLVCFLSACAKEVPLPSAETYPAQLSAWNLVWREGESLKVHQSAFVYDVNTPLFSDYALKLRTLFLPGGEAAAYHDTEAFDFPVGTVITKTFFYERGADGSLTRNATWSGDASAVNFTTHQIVETRLLIRQAHGWDALPYVWNGNDAELAITGKLIKTALDGDEFAYLVPSRNECAGCHVTNHTAKALLPIGLKARHLNRLEPAGTHNQLALLDQRGALTGLPELDDVPTAVNFADTNQPVVARARTYLDANCGHCHNAQGAADTSGLLLDALATDERQMGQCKAPIAAGRGTGGRLFSVVPGQPDASILLWRMETDDPATRMPEVGRSLVHAEGAALIREWIDGLPGEC